MRCSLVSVLTVCSFHSSVFPPTTPEPCAMHAALNAFHDRFRLHHVVDGVLRSHRFVDRGGRYRPVTEQGATFGDLLRQYRTAAGLSQEGLAEKAGISRRAISDLERGARTRPWRDTVILLANALDLNADERDTLERVIARTRKPAPIPLRPPAGLAALELN